MGTIVKTNKKSQTQSINLGNWELFFTSTGTYQEDSDYNTGFVSVSSEGNLRNIYEIRNALVNKTKSEVTFDLNLVKKAGRLLGYNELIVYYYGNQFVEPVSKELSISLAIKDVDRDIPQLFSHTLYVSNLSRYDIKDLNLNKLLDKEFNKNLLKKSREVSDDLDPNETDKELDKLNLTSATAQTAPFITEANIFRTDNWAEDIARLSDIPNTTEAAGTGGGRVPTDNLAWDPATIGMNTVRIQRPIVGIDTEGNSFSHLNERAWNNIIGVNRPSDTAQPRIIDSRWRWVEVTLN